MVTYVGMVLTWRLLRIARHDAIEYRTMIIYSRLFFSLSIEYSIVKIGLVLIAVRMVKVRVEIEPLRRRCINISGGVRMNGTYGFLYEVLRNDWKLVVCYTIYRNSSKNVVFDRRHFSLHSCEKFKENKFTYVRKLN